VKDTPRVREFSEDQLIARISQYLLILDDVELGPGDDAALVAAPDGRFLVTTDVLVEGRHFVPEWISPVDLGRRAMAQNFADIAAMGARTTSVVVALTIPGDLAVSWLEDLAAGMGQYCAESGASLVGGDLARGEAISIAVTAMGNLDGAAPVLRSGARAGDVIAHAGNIGWGAAGFALLEAGFKGSPEAKAQEVKAQELISAHQVPQPPLKAGVAARRAGATAMLDVSDGLVRDGARLAAASGVVLNFDAAALAAYEEVIRPAAKHLGLDPRTWVLSGGEDHGLLATFPPDALLPDVFTAVGQVLGVPGEEQEQPGNPGVLIEHQPVQIPPGWDHFGG